MDLLKIFNEKCDQYLAVSGSVPTPSRTRREKKPAIKQEVQPPSTEASNRKKGRKIVPANENLKGASKPQVSAFTASLRTEQPNTTNVKPKSSKKRSEGTGSLDFDRKSTKKSSIDHAQGLKHSGGKNKRKRSSTTELSDGTPSAVASAARACASVDCPPDHVAMVSQEEEELPSFSFGNEVSLENFDAPSQKKGRRRKGVAIVSSQSIIADDALIVTVPALMPATVANPNSNLMVATMPVHEIKNPYFIEYSFHQKMHRNPAATLAQNPSQELNVRSWFMTQEGSNKADFRYVPIKMFRTILQHHEYPREYLCLQCYSSNNCSPLKCQLKEILSRLHKEEDFSNMCIDCIVPNKDTVCNGTKCMKAVQRLAFFRAIRAGQGFEKMRRAYIGHAGEDTTYLLEAATSDIHDVEKQIRWVFENWNSFSDALTAVGSKIFLN